MPVTNAIASQRRKRMLERAKAIRLKRSKLDRYASDAADRALRHAYRDRKAKKRSFRYLWQVRINAAARANGITYTRLITGLKAAQITLDRKLLADLAATDSVAFAKLVERAQDALKPQAIGTPVQVRKSKKGHAVRGGEPVLEGRRSNRLAVVKPLAVEVGASARPTEPEQPAVSGGQPEVYVDVAKVFGRKRAASRPSPLDLVEAITATTADLREDNGNLSAKRIAKVLGISLSQLANWLGRTKQAVSKTPDADSLQIDLGYFERMARLRQVLRNDGEFRKWLRLPNELLDRRTPLELIAKGRWQAMADYVEDLLSGAPT